jgi:D-alanyl-lipoteichoic acid acyltransferase DltB (MBOAT superfamily)
VRPPSYLFGDFALYVAFFPQLIAGPITRWSFLGPQLQSPQAATTDGVERGLFLIGKGLIKKVVFADSLGVLVDAIYVRPDYYSSIEVALAVYAYGFQIYFDFSGYTDIAQGLARLLGFRLPHNFRHPYRAVSPRDFWRRWHISLSSWLRDYLYVSLGGNRRGKARTYLNLLTTMVLGGLWHGAAWNFVLWGAFHGGWLALHRACATPTPRTPVWLRRLVTFHVVLVAWVLFRAPSLESIASMWRGLLGTQPMSGPFPVGPAALIAMGVLLHATTARVDAEAHWVRTPRVIQGALLAGVLLLVGAFSAQSQRFIYFQF